MLRTRLCLLLAPLACLGACADPPPLSSTTTQYEVVSRDLPEPSLRDITGNVREYVIGPFDRLSIGVYGIEGLEDREVQADGAGRISFPIAGTASAAGLTPLELQNELRRLLIENHVRDPQVTVNLLEVRSQIVTVEGEVGKPGLYPVLGDMTLLKSIATAEGLDEYARDEIVIFRKIDGQKYAAIYDLGAIRAGAYADPQVYGGDIIIVGESAQKRRFDKVLAAAPAILSPIVLLIR